MIKFIYVTEHGAFSFLGLTPGDDGGYYDEDTNDLVTDEDGNKVLEWYEAPITIDDLDLFFKHWGGPKRIRDEEARFRHLLTEQMGVSQELCEQLIAQSQARGKRGDYDPEYYESYFDDGYGKAWDDDCGEGWKNLDSPNDDA